MIHRGEFLPLRDVSDGNITDIPQEFFPPRLHQVQNQDQYFQGSVAKSREAIPSLSSSTRNSDAITKLWTNGSIFNRSFQSIFRQEWFDSCVSKLNDSYPGWVNLKLSEKEKLIVQLFLLSDMKLSCCGMLPKLSSLDQAFFPGPVVVQ
ncbi:hypothetical protein MKX03_002399, partial [Papaver bracteatum]